MTGFVPIAFCLRGLDQNQGTVLVCAAEGVCLCREGGYEKVPVPRGWPCIGTTNPHELAELRDVVSRAKLCALPPPALDDQRMLTLVENAIKSHVLVFVRAVGKEQSTPNALARLRRLVGQIETIFHGRLSHAGRQYKLVADADIGKLVGRDLYEVVQRDAAVQVLEAVAKQEGPRASEVVRLLAEAKGELTHDWRPPLAPEGLILLRRIVLSQAAHRSEEPAVSWSTQRVYTHITSVPPSGCQVTFPRLDTEAWSRC
jgi:hypothetical protein